MSEQRRLLGQGKSRNFTASPGWTLLEEGPNVYELPPDFFCTVCDGSGCRCCGNTGEEAKRLERNARGKNGPRKKQ